MTCTETSASGETGSLFGGGGKGGARPLSGGGGGQEDGIAMIFFLSHLLCTIKMVDSWYEWGGGIAPGLPI